MKKIEWNGDRILTVLALVIGLIWAAVTGKWTGVSIAIGGVALSELYRLYSRRQRIRRQG